MSLESAGIKFEDVLIELEKEKTIWHRRKKFENMKYDENNIFAKILRKEIPCDLIYEDEFVLSFHDINPQKKFML